MQSDGTQHLGTSQKHRDRPFPGPPPNSGHPLRVLPIGGLGEIGMNCMLVGVYDRYILIDAGLMFPDFTSRDRLHRRVMGAKVIVCQTQHNSSALVQDYGMQRILPDTSFLAEWADKIEALVITHGHEDHIGALPWVVPALGPDVPIYAANFPMQLIKRRLLEYTLWKDSRFKTFNMRDRFQCGPFEIEPMRVTHSIPDCCGLIMRSEYGNIVHTGDWKIDEDPLDSVPFDRDAFEQIGKEGVALMMSDSTNVLAPGRTVSERDVEANIARKIAEHDGKGRIVATQFSSNIHRLGSIMRAAQASNRRVSFIGLSLHTYLEAAVQAKINPIDPDDLVPFQEIGEMDPNRLLVVTTGSQGEDMAALNAASQGISEKLSLRDDDMILYAASVIPGNGKKVQRMFNRISHLGPKICNDPADGLHTSGHAKRQELEELLKIVKPQHFLPVHGEAAFLYKHAEVAQELGCRNTNVIRNGQMFGCAELSNNEFVSAGSAAKVLGEAKLEWLYNDGKFGTGTADDMAIPQRGTLAQSGIVIAVVDVSRTFDPEGGQGSISVNVRVTARGMWTDEGELLKRLHDACVQHSSKMPASTSLTALERKLASKISRVCESFNKKFPEIIVVVHEKDPRAAMQAEAAANHGESQSSNARRSAPLRKGRFEYGGERGGNGSGKGGRSKPPQTTALPTGMVANRKAANPRENPTPDADPDSLTYG